MRGPTHNLGGLTASLVVTLITILLCKQLPFETQMIIFPLAYFAIRYICELTAKLADTDQSITNLPVRNEFGYMMFGLAKKLEVQHRGPAIHDMRPYTLWLGIPSLTLLGLYLFGGGSLVALSMWIIVTSAFAGFESHLILDAFTLTGIYRNKEKFRFLKTGDHTFTKLHFKWLLIFPLIIKKRIKVPYADKVTGGVYEEHFRDNLFEINDTLFKLCLIVACLDLRAVWETLKIFV